MRDNSVAMIPCQCPTCGRTLDRAEQLQENEKIRPSPGDLTVCIGCAATLVFTNSAGDLRLATTADFDAIDAEALWELAKIEMAVREANRRKARA